MTSEGYRLYARPSFLEGVARVFDRGGVLNRYNRSRSEAEADYKAIASDWYTVGKDLREAISDGKKKNTSPKETK